METEQQDAPKEETSTEQDSAKQTSSDMNPNKPTSDMITIIVPTYNESKNIHRLIKEVSESMQGENFEILVMDDNSPDKTAEKARELESDFPVRVVVRTQDKGLAKSVVDGFKNAKGDTMLVMDADLSHPPTVIPRMIKRQRETDAEIVVASRLVEGGGTEDWPNSRKLTSYCASLLARPLTNIRDPMSGFFLLKRSVVEDAELKPTGYKILLEILVRGNYKKSVEEPFIFRDRTAGESKLNMKVNMQYAAQVFTLYGYKIKKSLHL
jgi:dolichol-phosphate mannosyltransferase